MNTLLSGIDQLLIDSVSPIIPNPFQERSKSTKAEVLINLRKKYSQDFSFILILITFSLLGIKKNRVPTNEVLCESFQVSVYILLDGDFCLYIWLFVCLLLKHTWGRHDRLMVQS